MGAGVPVGGISDGVSDGSDASVGGVTGGVDGLHAAAMTMIRQMKRVRFMVFASASGS
jgi:hypothetical protein